MKDQNTRAYLAFKEFYDYHRLAGVSIIDFIVRFEYLYHKLKQFDMKLPEGVQVVFLLNAANISEDNENWQVQQLEKSLMKYERKNTENIWRSCCL